MPSTSTSYPPTANAAALAASAFMIAMFCAWASGNHGATNPFRT